MTVQTLIKQAQKSGLVIIPRREYDELLKWKKAEKGQRISDEMIERLKTHWLTKDKTKVQKAGLKKLDMPFSVFKKVRREAEKLDPLITKKDIEKWK